ncbi:hypothetical protein BGX26_004650 [Mortierella sp. AD094]|nr:hypothetical protein BGX26_004650 [Mortierella sp. AD094]
MPDNLNTSLQQRIIASPGVKMHNNLNTGRQQRIVTSPGVKMPNNLNTGLQQRSMPNNLDTGLQQQIVASPGRRVFGLPEITNLILERLVVGIDNFDDRREAFKDLATISRTWHESSIRFSVEDIIIFPRGGFKKPKERPPIEIILKKANVGKQLYYVEHSSTYLLSELVSMGVEFKNLRAAKIVCSPEEVPFALEICGKSPHLVYLEVIATVVNKFEPSLFVETIREYNRIGVKFRNPVRQDLRYVSMKDIGAALKNAKDLEILLFYAPIPDAKACADKEKKE